MSASASRPEPATTDQVWRVEVAMPVHAEGRNRGKPVGWQRLNNLPASVAQKIDWDRGRREWRIAAYVAVVAAGVPRRLGRISVTVEFRFPTSGDRDPGNFEPTVKSCVDALGPQRVYRSPAKKRDFGLVVELGRGVIETDSPRHLVRPNPIIGEPLGTKSPVKGMVILHIRPLCQDP